MSSEASQFFERLRAYSPATLSALLSEPKHSLQRLDYGLSPEFKLGEELKSATAEIAECGRILLRLSKPPLSDRIRLLLDHLGRLATRIAVVGQIKAGKSSFINALARRPDFLPTHVNPWTAVPTKLYFGVEDKPAKGAFFEFFNADEWGRLSQAITLPVAGPGQAARNESRDMERAEQRRAALRIGDQFHHLLGYAHRYESISPKVLAHYLCAGPAVSSQSRNPQAGRYADITRLAHIYLPMEPFSVPTVLVDTPGLNDPSFARLRATENLLEHADIYIVILTASQPMGLADITLLKRLRGLEKRRILVFINRIDELAGGITDAKAVEAHVRVKLREEIGDAEVSVASGSARWAQIAAEGSEAQLRQTLKLRTLHSYLSKARRKGDVESDPSADVNKLRAMIFEASGMPRLMSELSDLMLESFLSGEGAGYIKTLKATAEITASTARRELAVVGNMMAQPVAEEPMLFDQAIAQLGKRLKDTERVQDTTSALIAEASRQINDLRQQHSEAIRCNSEKLVREFAREQRSLVVRRLAEAGGKSWRCNTGSLLERLEAEFIRIFSSGLEQIEIVHDQCVGAVKSRLEQSHTPSEQRSLRAQQSTKPDVRAALPRLSELIEVEIVKPWWSGWWRNGKIPEEKADALEQKILGDFLPIGACLASLADRDLTGFAAHVVSTLSESVNGTIRGTAARLVDLRSRLLQHNQLAQHRRQNAVKDDYVRSFDELTEMKSSCETVISRLSRIGEGATL